MNQQSWLIRVVFIGVVYAGIGVVFTLPASGVHMWRLAAWAASAALYVAHIAYESLRLRNPPRSAAAHVGIAVAIGGFALAVAAIVHSWFIAPNYPRSRLLFALVAWPLITGIPAFFVALVAVAIQRAFRRNGSD